MNIYTLTAINGDAVRFYSFHAESDTSARAESNRFVNSARNSIFRDAEAWLGKVVLTKQVAVVCA